MKQQRCSRGHTCANVDFEGSSLSVAFTKEESAETASETLLPDRPISPHPNLVTEGGLRALESQLQAARDAYEAAQPIEDVNERRRQSAIPLRDVRYFAERVRTAPLLAGNRHCGGVRWRHEVCSPGCEAARDGGDAP